MNKVSNLIIAGTTILTGVLTYKITKKYINKEQKIIITPGENEYFDYELNKNSDNFDNEKNYILLKTFKKTCN